MFFFYRFSWADPQFQQLPVTNALKGFFLLHIWEKGKKIENNENLPNDSILFSVWHNLIAFLLSRAQSFVKCCFCCWQKKQLTDFYIYMYIYTIWLSKWTNGSWWVWVNRTKPFKRCFKFMHQTNSKFILKHFKHTHSHTHTHT